MLFWLSAFTQMHYGSSHNECAPPASFVCNGQNTSHLVHSGHVRFNWAQIAGSEARGPICQGPIFWGQICLEPFVLTTTSSGLINTSGLIPRLYLGELGTRSCNHHIYWRQILRILDSGYKIDRYCVASAIRSIGSNLSTSNIF